MFYHKDEVYWYYKNVDAFFAMNMNNKYKIAIHPNSEQWSIAIYGIIFTPI